MNLLIISHTPHYMKQGVFVGWGATVREIDYLATLFDNVTHIAPVYKQKAPESSIAYRNTCVQVKGVSPAGGERLRDKFSILWSLPQYINAIRKELKTADVVHVRCPANISLVAVLMLYFAMRPRIRWIKYAGNWQPNGKEALSYTLQRWLLRSPFHRGQVTVNGSWPNQPRHVHTFFNPCLTNQELREGDSVVAKKVLSSSLRIIYVGRLESAKGVGRILQIAAKLKTQGVNFLIDLIGDGPERGDYEAAVKELGIAECINFHGWLPREALGNFYSQAHLMLLPSTASEGWPKVLSEAMAYGVVPISSNVSSIPQYLKNFNVGKTCSPENIEGFTDAIKWYARHPEVWATESRRGWEAARSFSYINYLEAVKQLLKLEDGHILSQASPSVFSNDYAE